MRPINRFALTQAWLLIALVIQLRMTQAATITYSLTGGAAIPCPSCASGDLQASQVPLVDSTTGSSVLVGFTLNVGDTIDGTVTLSTPLTVPAGTGFNGITLFLLGAGPGYTLNYTDSLSFYDNGVQVAPPSEWSNINSADGAVLLGAVSPPSYAPAFTFDELVFGATITSMFDQSGNPINSVNLAIFNEPSLTAVASPVPLPTTVWLLLSGIGGLGAVFAKRKVI